MRQDQGTEKVSQTEGLSNIHLLLAEDLKKNKQTPVTECKVSLFQIITNIIRKRRDCIV